MQHRYHRSAPDQISEPDNKAPDINSKYRWACKRVCTADKEFGDVAGQSPFVTQWLCTFPSHRQSKHDSK